MIPKKTADLRPEKLRLILLMDARFNHNNKLIGKKMMEYGEKHGLLANEQYGSRKSKSAIEHAIEHAANKRIVMDVVRQSGGRAIYIANDAKSCYDRIILMVAYLTMRNSDIPQLVAQSTIYTIMNMKHVIRTKFGDSKRYYGGDKWTTKPHGCGQGNGYGPALWACISSPLLHILRHEGYGTIIHHPISRSQLHLSAFAFVDDTDIIQTSNNGSPLILQNTHNAIQELYSHTQCALDLWSQSLKESTGGALEPGKTFCVPIISTWKGAHKILKKKDDTYQIYLPNKDGHPKPIEEKDPNDAFFTLGIWQSPSGDETKQKQHLLAKIEDLGKHTKENRISWILARIAIKATIGRTLCYPLGATSFDALQCKELQTVYLRHTLGKVGIVRTVSPLIACAPMEYGGLDLMSFEVEQLVKQIDILIQHGPE
jgi:Reverse transcriptase (RNA-dependent DNA polymerase).